MTDAGPTDDDRTSERPVLRAGAATDVGQVRTINQDDLLVADGFYAVADGMGGHQGGEVAAELAVASLSDSGTVTSMRELTEGIQAANRVIIERAGTDSDLAGMGTTVCVLALLDGFGGARLALANVGDSRVYVLRDGQLVQLTLDHSLVAELVREGRITEEEAEHHPRKNVVTRALGVAESVDIDTWELPLVVGERFLLCSDGLFNEVTDNQIEGALRRLADPDEAAAELVRMANDGGGRDNITVVVVDVVEPGAHAASAQAIQDEADAGRGAGDASLDRAPPAEPDQGRQPFFTWRTALFAAALVGVLIAVVWVIGLVARGTYFVGVDDQDRVVVYRGQPDGVLWFDPTVEQVTDLTIDDVPVEQRDDVEGGAEFGSLDAALDYVDNLADQQASDPPASRAGPTTTVGAPTTTS